MLTSATETTVSRVIRTASDEEAADGPRTRDLKLGKLALYQLSYHRAAQILSSMVPTWGADLSVGGRRPHRGRRLPWMSQCAGS